MSETEQRAWAEALHAALCTRSHVDQCDWAYGGWDRRWWRNDARKDHLTRAERLRQQYPDWKIEDLLAIHKAVRGG